MKGISHIYRIAKSWTAIWVLTILVMAAGCSKPTDTGAKSEPKAPVKCSLRLKWIMVSGFSGELAAKENGYFAEEGLDVTVLPGGMENKPEKLVAAGADTFGITGADGILLARAKGIPLVAFAAQYARNAAAFFSLKDSGITEPNDFAGKKIGVKYGTEMDPIYRALIKNCAVDTSGTTEVPMSYSIAPLLDGQVDVFPSYMNSIFPYVTEKNVVVNVIDPDKYGIHFHGNVYFCAEKTLRENPELVVGFTRAVLKGWEWASENPDKVGELVKKYNPTADPDSEVKALHVILPYLLPENGKLGWMDRVVVEQTKAILRDAGVLEGDVAIDDCFTWSILDEICGK